MLEEGSFRGRTADFVFMFLFGGMIMTVSFQHRPVQPFVHSSMPLAASIRF